MFRSLIKVVKRKLFTSPPPDPVAVVRLVLKAYDPRLLQASCDQLIKSITAKGDKVTGPIPLPTKKRIYCVLRSPHINKDSREHFEIRIHTRLMDIYVMSKNSFEKLHEIDLPSGVCIIRKR